jgi:hypothetical protein
MSDRAKFILENYGGISGDPEACEILNAHPAWVELWERRGHLRSLGGRTKGCQRFYSTKYLFSLRHDEEWLDKAIKMIRLHFRQKNGKEQA